MAGHDVSAKRVSRSPRDTSAHDEPSEVRRTFARNLRQAREAAGLTQHALATVAACDPRLLANIETRAANVKLDTITRLARALSVTEIDLLLPDMTNIPIKRGRRPPVEPLSKTGPTEFRRQFARNLREKRRAAGLFQKALSKVAGVQGAAVAEIEVNAINVTLDTVTRLARALGVTEIDLLGTENG
jgi:transcriptional regulator with XRE-family HTH domain